MEKINSIIIVCLVLCSICLTEAQQDKPIIISPYTGTALDRVERDYFKVLPGIEGFEEAQFYLNPDNSLRAVIKLNRNGVESDTVLERYSSQRRLETLIVNNLLKNISIDENKIVSIKLKERNDLKNSLDNSTYVLIMDKSGSITYVNQKILRTYQSQSQSKVLT